MPMPPQAGQAQVPAVHPQIAGEMSSINRRVRLIEEQISTLRSQIEMLSNSLLEKHRSSTDDIRGVQVSMDELKSELAESKETFQRLVNRMDDFASKENLKVLERYISYWDPLHYVTKQEVADMISSKRK